MTVRRCKLTHNAVEISTAGVDVESANFSQKQFSAKNRSIPLLLKTAPVSLNRDVGQTTTLLYGKTFSRPPMSAVLLTPNYPTSAGPYEVVSAMQSGNDVYYMIDWAISSGGYVGAATGTNVIRKADRIELTNWQSGSSATTLYGFSGWAWAVVFDYE